jgi:hypothetical protein
MSNLSSLKVAQQAFCGQVGIARRDITPPVGIHSRMWGSASHEVAAGVHRPLLATVLAIQAEGQAQPHILASVDLCWWRTAEDEWWMRGPILKESGIDEANFILHITHTHAGPSTSLASEHKPGGEKIRPYMTQVRQALIEAIREAMAAMQPAELEWHTGSCHLACNRDQPNPDGDGTIVGHVPTATADDTLLVGRVTDANHQILATIVNYACHPTTLGGANQLISPDYVGAMREVVETETNAPCLFLNGAAGDLAPRRQYSGDANVADQNGRQLGHAALAALYDMLPPGSVLQFHSVENSSTRLGRWEPVESPADGTWSGERIDVELILKNSRPGQDPAQSSEVAQDRATLERNERAILLWNGLAGATTLKLPVWIWRMGDAVMVGTPAEMHSPFQLALRQAFPEYAIIVMNLVNGSMGYIPPDADYDLGTYQATIATVERGSHEFVTAACIEAIESLLPDARRTADPPSPYFRLSKGAFP